MQKPNPTLLIHKLPIGTWIALGILALGLSFFLGTLYQKELDGKITFSPNTYPPPLPTTAPIVNQNLPPQVFTCRQDSDCMLFNKDDISPTSLCCHNNSCYGKEESMIAVNKQTYQQAQTAYCNPKQICPMYAVSCTPEQTKLQQTTKATCISGMCQKTKTN